MCWPPGLTCLSVCRPPRSSGERSSSAEMAYLPSAWPSAEQFDFCTCAVGSFYQILTSIRVVTSITVGSSPKTLVIATYCFRAQVRPPLQSRAESPPPRARSLKYRRGVPRHVRHIAHTCHWLPARSGLPRPLSLGDELAERLRSGVEARDLCLLGAHGRGHVGPRLPRAKGEG